MERWESFCKLVQRDPINEEELRTAAAGHFDSFGIYPGSINDLGGCLIFMADGTSGKCLVAYGSKHPAFNELAGFVQTVSDRPARICSLSIDNSKVIRRHCSFTNPVSHQGRDISIGLGDRLGMASPGHIRLVRKTAVFPVLAQQSIRELNLTGRNYHEVLAAAVWAVFQEGYRDGYGADGDHLKTADEVRMALDCGFSMITLDCSEHIDNAVASLPAPQIENLYMLLPGDERDRYSSAYLQKDFFVADGCCVRFQPDDFMRTVLVYRKAIGHTADIFKTVISKAGRPIDFEVSIDETLTPTSPESHFFTASELAWQGVAVTSVAPKFCGEFQKGIDYRGSLSQFEEDFRMHAKIADHFGYKISVHSGSDKFTVFPVIGAETRGRFHLKTAGTNWLEAVRIIAAHQPDLYRLMHAFALENLAAAKKYYHISADPSRIASLSHLSDDALAGLMDQDDARQVLHITYGLILQARNPDGSYRFRDAFFAALARYENEYSEALQRHIGRHLARLGVTGISSEKTMKG